MELKYLEIKIKNIKDDLTAVADFFKDGNLDNAEEYLQDVLNTVKNLKSKIKN